MISIINLSFQHPFKRCTVRFPNPFLRHSWSISHQPDYYPIRMCAAFVFNIIGGCSWL